MTKTTRKRRKSSSNSGNPPPLNGFDPAETAGDCRYDAAAGNLVIDFFHKYIRHVKGDLAGKKIELALWQRSILQHAFGWKRPDGTRRYREVFIYVPRKNGKTTFLGGLINFMLFCDGERGAEIYSAACDRDQAALVYEQAKGMVLTEPDLASRANVHKSFRSIVFEKAGSSYKPVSAEADTKHGYNAHFVVIDELHAMPEPSGRDLVNTLITSTGSRRQPLVVYITTADYERESICNERYDYACKVRDGIIDDPYFLPVIYEASIEDDWTLEATWKKANPNLGVSISLEYLQRECRRAQESSAYENTFKRLHLNIKTEQDVRWLKMDFWDACASNPDPEKLKGKICYAGLDLATTTDIAALVLAFHEDGKYQVLPFFWVPRDGAVERERRDRVPYITWARAGLIEMTEGNVIDYDFIRRRIGEIGKLYNIKEIAIDRWNSTQLQTQLAGDGFEIIQFGQGFASMSAPTKELEKLVLGKMLEHGGNAVLRWMASNVSVEIDAAGNLKPSKKRSTEKIDGIVSLVMAIGRMIVTGGKKPSIYETRGPLIF